MQSMTALPCSLEKDLQDKASDDHPHAGVATGTKIKFDLSLLIGFDQHAETWWSNMLLAEVRRSLLFPFPLGPVHAARSTVTSSPCS